MAAKKITATKADGKYAIVEVNQLASRTTGAMIADAPLAKDFKTVGKEGDTQEFAENGMILYFDPTADRASTADGKTKGAWVGTAKEGLSYGLVFSTEHFYDSYNRDLASFKITKPQDDNMLVGSQFEHSPRVYTLAMNDKFTTDAVVNDDTDSLADKIGTSVVYGEAKGGYIVLTETKPTVGPVLQAIAKTTTPASYGGVVETAIKFMVTEA